MPEYRISPDQGVCPEGHPCHSTPDHPAFRECDTPHQWPNHPRSQAPYGGEALYDVYTGPVGVEAYQTATAALRSLMADHEESQHFGDNPDRCPGVEVCETIGAGWLRAIQDVIDPIPSYERAMDGVYAAAAAEAEARRAGRIVPESQEAPE